MPEQKTIPMPGMTKMKVRMPTVPKMRVQKRRPKPLKHLLKLEVDLIDNGYKMLSSFVTHKAAHRYAAILREEDFFAQVIDRVRETYIEYRVYARARSEEAQVPAPPEEGLLPRVPGSVR